MTAENIDFTDKPVRLIMENDIVSDIVYENDVVDSKKKKILKRLESSMDLRDFFIVVLDVETDKIKGIITFKELQDVISEWKKGKNVLFKDAMVSPTTICYSESIQKVVSLLESSKSVNIVLVTNENNKYLGKIKRTNLDKRLNDFINTFKS